MTIEISRGLLGERIRLEPSDAFWFFSVGTGAGNFWPLEHSYNTRKFGSYNGWFTVDFGEQPGNIIFEWEFKTGDATTSRGYIDAMFERIYNI